MLFDVFLFKSKRFVNICLFFFVSIKTTAQTISRLFLLPSKKNNTGARGVPTSKVGNGNRGTTERRGSRHDGGLAGPSANAVQFNYFPVCN